MSTPKKPEVTTATCPACGSVAEKGCLYGADRGGLRWLAGPASWIKNLATGFGDGESVGKYGPLTGPYVSGIRCRACRRIILDYQDTE